MHAVAVMTTTAEYDLVDEHVSAEVIEADLRKPLAAWDAAALEPGETQALQRAFILRSETRTIEIDREEKVVWVTYVVTIEVDYNPEALGYFGTTLETIVQNGCGVSFPLDERVVELVDEQSSLALA